MHTTCMCMSRTYNMHVMYMSSCRFSKRLAHMSIGAAPPPGAWPGLYRVSLALCADPLLVPTGALQVRFVYGCAAA